MKHTNGSSNELICMWRRTASQAASGAYAIVDGPLLVEIVDDIVFVLAIVEGTGLLDFCLACRKAISEQWRS